MSSGHNDSDLIEMLFKKYYDRLMVIACSYTQNRTDAEDLVQETFLRAILSWQPTGSFPAWAGIVLRNLFFNQSKTRHKMTAMPKDDETLMNLLPDRQSIFEQNRLLADFIENEERRELAAMIASLPIKYRTVMIDSIYLEMSDPLIAKANGTTTANIRQIRSRAKKLLLKMREEDMKQDQRRHP